MKNFCLTAIIMLMYFNANGQSRGEVESKIYDAMLGTLLDRSVNEISAGDAYHQQDSVIWLDARTPREYEVSKIPGAKYVGYDDFDPARVEDLPKDQRVVVYCAVGYRSEKIAEKLQGLGFDEVYNLYGGIFEWANREQPLINQNGHDTDTVHVYSRSWGIWLKKGTKVYK